MKETYVGNTICHRCKESISLDTAHDLPPMQRVHLA